MLAPKFYPNLPCLHRDRKQTGLLKREMYSRLGKAATNRESMETESVRRLRLSRATYHDAFVTDTSVYVLMGPQRPHLGTNYEVKCWGQIHALTTVEETRESARTPYICHESIYQQR